MEKLQSDDLYEKLIYQNDDKFHQLRLVVDITQTSARENKTYFPRRSFFQLNRNSNLPYTEYIPFGIAGRAKAEIEYTWVDNPVFIKDKTTEEYLECLVNGEDCYCHDGKILMSVTTTII